MERLIHASSFMNWLTAPPTLHKWHKSGADVRSYRIRKPFSDRSFGDHLSASKVQTGRGAIQGKIASGLTPANLRLTTVCKSARSSVVAAPTQPSGTGRVLGLLADCPGAWDVTESNDFGLGKRVQVKSQKATGFRVVSADCPALHGSPPSGVLRCSVPTTYGRANEVCGY